MAVLVRMLFAKISFTFTVNIITDGSENRKHSKFVTPRLGGDQQIRQECHQKSYQADFLIFLSVRVTIAILDDSLFFQKRFYGLGGTLRLPL